MPETAEALDLNALIQQSAADEKAALDKQIKEQEAFDAQAKERLTQAREAKQPEIEKLQQRQSAVEAVEPPQFQRPPEAPNTQEMLQPTNLQRTFGMASIFGLLAVGLAKGSAIYGLKALGGFMKGAHEGNIEQASAALKDYTAKMQEVHAANEATSAEYNAIFNNKKYDFEMQDRMVGIKAAEFRDELMQQAGAQGGMNARHKLLQDRANVGLKMTDELLRLRQIDSQLQWHMEVQRRADKAGSDAITEAQIAKIEDQARQEVSGMLPRDQLGNIILSEEWGKTLEDRYRKFTGMVDKRKREIAAHRGLSGIFDKTPEVKEDPAMALRHAISSGQLRDKDGKVSKDLAEQFLIGKMGLDPARAVEIVKEVRYGPSEY